jgi:hypothetical protein
VHEIKGICDGDKILQGLAAPLQPLAPHSSGPAAQASTPSKQTGDCNRHAINMMLSSALSQVLERARTRFGLEVEILDAELRNLYPQSGTELGLLARENAALRQTLREVLAGGHPRDIDEGGRRYRVYPLRHSERIGHKGALLAVRGQENTEVPQVETGPWSEFAKAAIEADLSAADTLREERQSSRRLLAILRFLRYLLESTDEGDLTQALVQAAAVWFDVDARVYRRDLAGQFSLHNWLPAVDPDEASRRLDGQIVGSDRDVKRLAASPELGSLSYAGGETVLVPLAGPSRIDWVMTLSGAVPSEADSVFQVVGRVVGVQLESLHARRIDEARRRFETIVRQSGLAAERMALQLVGELVQAVGAASASLTLVINGASRRIVSFGPPSEDATVAPGDTWVMTGDRFVCGLALAPNQRAVLELRPAPDVMFSTTAADLTVTCAHVLQTWLVGAVSTFTDPMEQSQAPAAPPSAFEKRIEEELERAKRFDLHLSLVLVDVTAPSQALAQIQEALRRELRGSDLLGTTSGRHVAALLTHTDDRGLDNVVVRLRRRLADAADRLNISDVKLGQAALSPDCRTADALLSRAVRGAEPIVVH